MERQEIYYSAPFWLQNVLVSAYGSYLKRKRRGANYAGIQERIAAVSRWSRQAVEEYQGERLHHMVQHCYAHVPYYRDLLSSAKLTPDDFRNLGDLSRLPILEKEEVRTCHTRLLASGARPYWTQNTSGSTGTPLPVHLDGHTYQLFAALLADHEARYGVGLNDLRATFAGRMVQPLEQDSAPFWRYNRADRQVLFSAYHLSDRTIPAYLTELQRIQPQEIIGYPSAIYTVAEYCLRNGVRPNIHPRVVVTNSETLWAWQRVAIERAFGCRVADYYGSAECVAFAGECEAGAYHFNPLLSIVEIVDSEGKPAPAGTPGALVCTTLTNDVMPLLRYRIGDEAVRLAGPCSCGSVWESVEAIVGRQDDSIITPDGRAIGRIDHIFKGMVGIRECQVIQETITRVRLDVVADGSFDALQRALLERHLRERIGDAFDVQVQRVADIPRTRNGKFRGVISHVSMRRSSGGGAPEGIRG